MPGPDGIPYRAWRALGNMAVSVLHDVAGTLAGPEAERLLQEAYADEVADGSHLYNLSTLICLPKKAAGNDDDAGTYYTPDGTRPLSIVNTDNRLVANATRLRWESMLCNWISSNQQGFLPGRSILANLLALDTGAIHTALSGPNGAVVLFDFKAAFPSVSQQYLSQTLAHIGLPIGGLQLVASLYDTNHCEINIQGQQYPGFCMTSGVRQGCPLSPLLYALVAGALLEKACATIPGIWIRAYADDTAVILTDFWDQAPILARVFDDFAAVSNLQLNCDKCVVILLNPKGCPLTSAVANETYPAVRAMASDARITATGSTGAVWSSLYETEPLRTMRTNLGIVVPAWNHMIVAWEGQYLGFAVGPGKKDSSWTKPAPKYAERSRMWTRREQGLQYTALTYNMFAVSTLSYLVQLECPPDWLYDQERTTLGSVIGGPACQPGYGGWATPEDLWHLKDYGLPQ